MKALIIGGGIGGLATAVALGRVGVEAEVFERAPEIGEVGAGLSLWSNAIKMLRAIGLDEEVVSLGSTIERSSTLRDDGRLIDATPIGDLSRRSGAPSVCVHRAELQGVLMRAVSDGRLWAGRECVGFDQDGSGVTARFADGSVATGDVLAGADGLRSAVRKAVHGPVAPRPAGYSAWRGIAPIDHPDIPAGSTFLILGPGCQVGLFPCGPGRVYWFATRDEAPPASDRPGPHKGEILDHLGRWWRPIREVIEATPEAAVLKNPIFDRPPVRNWGRGRVTFVGDAIHPTTPNLGQGACQALEDAVALADSLRPGGDPVANLRRYEHSRTIRTAMVVNQSRALGRILQWQNPLLVSLRTLLLRTPLSRRQAGALFETLLNP